MKQINIQVTKPQAAFHSMTCKYPAFIAGYGAGKSETLLNQAILDASVSVEALIALYSPTYDLVRLILAPRLLAKLAEFGIEYDYNKTENYITTKSGQFGNFILRSLDTPERIVGYESFRAHIDEIDILNENQANSAWNKIIARNRQKLPVKDSMNRVSVYTTPEGFKFVYDRWVKHKKDGYELIRAPSYSNPFLPKDYIESLRLSYSDELIKAYIEGEFVNLVSGTVYKSFDRAIHCSNESIIPKETLYIGQDFNVGKMASTIYVKRTKIEFNLKQNSNNLITIWHAVAELSNLYDTPSVINAIKQTYPEHHIIIYPDASGSSRKSTDASVSDIALLQQAGFEIRAPRKNPFVKDRVAAVNTAFSKQLLFINTKMCPNVTNCLEQQSYDDYGEPDKKSGNDHQNDATGYPIVFEMPVKKPIFHIPVTFHK